MIDSDSHLRADRHLYDFDEFTLEGKAVNLGELCRRKVCLIVNVASQCGFTFQNYKELNELYSKYHHRGLEIVAFPCNQFGRQERGTPETIRTHLTDRFDPQFPIMAKIDVSGPKARPLWLWMQALYPAGRVQWNFTKFLFDRRGHIAGKFHHSVSPLSLESRVEELLEERSRTADAAR
eukprot:TRINITY_DN33381_c0_g1_i1.p1 TRINITY_DN33381_c0_g1~~TRINITY_DN33381_c0_g1_i1.p1  ORF type:complete len:179 (-),score=8.39 TRINITY_DN33381_c0_g1_i1:196-732(-)